VHAEQKVKFDDNSIDTLQHKAMLYICANRKIKSHFHVFFFNSSTKKHTMKKEILLIIFLTAILFACNNPDQKATVKNIETQKPNIDSGFKVTSVKHEQHYKATFNFKTKKAKVDNSSKTEVAVDYLIKISDKEIIISSADGKVIAQYKIIHREENKKDGVIVYDTKDSNDIRFQVSHIVNENGTYGYFEFRSSENLKFYTTI
jgi:uncharacterized protein YcfL